MKETEKIAIMRLEVIETAGQKTFSQFGGYSFEYVYKNGEEALIAWIKNGEVLAEIKESNCNLFF